MFTVKNVLSNSSQLLHKLFFSVVATSTLFSLTWVGETSSFAMAAMPLMSDKDDLLQNQLAIVFENDRANAHYSADFEFSGDYNNDTFIDLLVGAPGLSINLAQQGAIICYLSDNKPLIDPQFLLPLTDYNQSLILGEGTGDRIGQWIAKGRGDLTEDNIDDISFGSIYYNKTSTEQNHGVQYILKGQLEQWPANIYLDTLTTAQGSKLVGDVAQDSLGFASLIGPDINNDGILDLHVAAPNYVSPFQSTQTGAIFVKLGTPDFTSTESFNVASFNVSNGVSYFGESIFAKLGADMSLLGDVDNNGFTDYAYVSPKAVVTSRSNAGKIYVFFGNANVPAFQNELDQFSASQGMLILGATNDELKSIENINDVDGDGFSDLLVCSDEATTTNGFFAGKCYLVWGRDSWPSTLDLAAFNQNEGVELLGPEADSGFGISAIGLNSFDGDYYADFAIGQSFVVNSIFEGPGTVYMFQGKPRSYWPATINMQNFSLSEGFKITGAGATDGIGSKLKKVPDINGDSRVELGFNAPKAGAQEEGKLFFLLSNTTVFNSTFPPPPTSTSARLISSGFFSSTSPSLAASTIQTNNGAQVSSTGLLNSNSPLSESIQVSQSTSLLVSESNTALTSSDSNGVNPFNQINLIVNEPIYVTAGEPFILTTDYFNFSLGNLDPNLLTFTYIGGLNESPFSADGEPIDLFTYAAMANGGIEIVGVTCESEFEEAQVQMQAEYQGYTQTYSINLYVDDTCSYYSGAASNQLSMKQLVQQGFFAVAANNIVSHALKSPEGVHPNFQ